MTQSMFSILLLCFVYSRAIMAVPQRKPVTVQEFGSIDGKIVEKYTLRNNKKQEVDVISYGAIITSIRTPDKNGKVADVALGFDDIEGYLSSQNPYFGATVGRVANRLGKASFTLDGKKYTVSKNLGQHSLHGGANGWNSKIWNATISGTSVVMTLLSEDGDEGYPGAVIASVTFSLSDSGELVLDMKSFTTKATPINLTNHSYFNLAGHGTNADEIYKHLVKINADRWTVTDADSIPTGEIRSVANSVMDLRKSTVLGNVINKVPGGGYDYNFCLPEISRKKNRSFVAKVVHPASKRYLEVYSNQPGVQFYTANSLPDPGTSGISGKQNQKYFKHGAFCLETQNYPDAINHDNFPNSVLRPGELYDHIVIYKFGVEA